jgi:hypothetical protein
MAQGNSSELNWMVQRLQLVIQYGLGVHKSRVPGPPGELEFVLWRLIFTADFPQLHKNVLSVYRHRAASTGQPWGLRIIPGVLVVKRGSWFTSPSRRLESGNGSYIFGKCVDTFRKKKLQCSYCMKSWFQMQLKACNVSEWTMEELSVKTVVTSRK